MLWGGAATGGALELRRNDDGGARLSGRFPYNSPAVLSDGGRNGGRPRKEVIAPGAFNYRIDLPDEDINLLVGHNYDMPLASKKTGTLSFKDTATALLLSAIITPAIAETTHGKDALALISAGLAVGISPGFRIPPPRTVPDAEKIEDEDPKLGTAIIRTIFAALLYEMSIVTRPAYSQAQIEQRNWNVTDGGVAVPVHPLNRWRL